jgi:hypothetical protein
MPGSGRRGRRFASAAQAFPLETTRDASRHGRVAGTPLTAVIARVFVGLVRILPSARLGRSLHGGRRWFARRQ